MPRPQKFRNICALPTITTFGPKGMGCGGKFIEMTVDEYEALRLIDYENMTQEACAIQMNIARTTAQSIYNSARKKVIEMLVTGAELRISGGSILLCQDRIKGKQCGHCRRKQVNREDNGIN